MSVTRIAQPVMHVDENVVEVHYQLFIRDKKKQEVSEVRECHRMRYLFKPEVEMFLEMVGFEVLRFAEFMKAEPPGRGKWNACFVSVKKSKQIASAP